MSVSQSIKYTWIKGTEQVATTVETVDEAEANLSVSVADGSDNIPHTFSLDVSATSQYFVMATQAMTVKTNGTDEVQTLSISGSPTGGTFTITYDGQTTSNLNYNATAAEVETALEALSNIDAVSTTGGPLPGTDVVITFEGTLRATNVALMTTADSLTGGSSPSSSIVETTAGVAADDTYTLTANVPLVWDDVAYFTNPFGTDITRLLLTNNSGSAGTFYFYATYDSTP